MIKEQEDPKLLRTFKGHKDEINTVAFHPFWYVFFHIASKWLQVLTIAWCSYGISILQGIYINTLDIEYFSA